MSGKHHLRDKWWPPEAEAVASASAPQQAGPDEDEWTTGHEPMTEPQASYLDTLAEDVGVDVPDFMTKAEASDLIDELQRRTDGDGNGEDDLGR